MPSPHNGIRPPGCHLMSLDLHTCLPKRPSINKVEIFRMAIFTWLAVLCPSQNDGRPSAMTDRPAARSDGDLIASTVPSTSAAVCNEPFSSVAVWPNS